MQPQEPTYSPTPSHRPESRASCWHNARVGVLFDYFSAASDEAAAEAIDLLGGPGIAARTSADGLTGVPGTTSERPPFDTVSAKGVDPLVQLGTLEALLTGREYELIVAERRAGRPLAIRHGGGRMVVTLTDQLQAALAAADRQQLASVAVPWSQTDEFWGRGDPEDLASLLRELAELAHRARGRGERMYCWVCV